jgi:hypothetical protein
MKTANPTNLNSDDALAILGGRIADALDDFDEALRTAKRLAADIGPAFDPSFLAGRRDDIVAVAAQEDRQRKARYATEDLDRTLGKLTCARHRLVRRMAEYAAEAGYPLEL